MTKRSTLGWGAVAALALAFIGLTIVFNYSLAGWQLDLTQNRLYTVSPGTDRILQSIKEPIDLYFYYSAKTAESIPQIRPYGQRVHDFLEELAQRSGGMIHLHVIDPQPFSVDEDRAAELGVTGTAINDAGTKFYFGLAGTNSTNGQQAIPFFDPNKQSFLEYDVVKLVYQLAHPAKPVVAWLSTLPMTGGYDPRSGQMRPPWTIYSQATQLFDVHTLQPTATSIGPDVRVLVLVDPKNLSPATQYAIDQYALRGGHIIAFVDPMAQSDQPAGNPMQSMGADRASHMEKLLSAWGVDFKPGEVIADRGHALTVAMREGQPPVEHLGILGLGEHSLSQADVITSGLSNVNVATAGYLAAAKGASIKFEPLIQSSADAEPMPAQRFAMLFNPTSLLDGFKPTGTRYTIAARITGMVKTAFPDGPPKGVTLPAGQRALKTSIKPFNLVVFADTDLLSDYLWVRQQQLFGQTIAQAWASNGDLVLNALDNLTGSSDLISVRGRAGFTRPFLRVDALRRTADAHFHAQEEQLQHELQQTEQQLTLLQSKRNDKSALILTPAQQQEIEHFEAEKLQIRKQLRAVQAGLVGDIDRLGTELKVLDIIVMPALFALAALLLAAMRRRRPAVVSSKKDKHP
ncbi:MAG TPA: Gldg family protein [Steroidobacteraceae bacterium]|nr:Gldg family protein [Steroidobacteraceae bacterium]